MKRFREFLEEVWAAVIDEIEQGNAETFHISL